MQLRPRTKKPAGRRAAKAGASSTGARRGRPPKGSSAANSAAGAARQLSAAAEALVDHITRLESELADARKDSQRLADIERALRSGAR